MAKQKDKERKTNALREVEAAGLAHRFVMFECEEALSGVEVAARLGEDPDRVFKTLVTEAKSGAHYVFMIPVACELDLKKAASVVGEKAVAMIKAKELRPHFARASTRRPSCTTPSCSRVVASAAR